MLKKLVMIAGPNGAGKTTTAHEYVGSDFQGEFINADEIARKLLPSDPEKAPVEASKLLIKKVDECLNNDIDFVFETTGSGGNYIKRVLSRAKSKNYVLDLVFLWLPSPEEAKKRVIQRVKEGGHFVKDEDIINRYYLGLKNLLSHFLPIFDNALIIDALSEDSNQIVRKDANGFEILDEVKWKLIQKKAYE